ncbi:hypothetical protein SAMN05216420_105141 [Nitrosospira sp. Nl5]|nr:hypothetical protein SAMN05216420_105141 [Nitrosospira sp. Nl5]
MPEPALDLADHKGNIDLYSVDADSNSKSNLKERIFLVRQVSATSRVRVGS